VLVDDAPGGLVEVAGPGVEPEPLPVLKDGVPIGVREGLNRGKGLQKAGIVVAYGVDPGIDRLCSSYQSSTSVRKA
jgi:hypothetical protein